MATEERPLSSQQERFAVLVAGGSMTQADAYRQAYPSSKSWKPTTVHECASRLAADRKVRARIGQLQAAAADRATLNATEILREVRLLAHSDIARIMNADGTVKLPHELDPGTRAAVKKFRIDELGRVEYEFWPKNDALDKAMRHLGLYEKDNAQQQGGLLALRDALLGSVVRPRSDAALPDPDDDDDVIDMPT